MSNTTLTATTPNVETTTWTIDGSHTQAQFKVRHMMIANVTGEFTKISGQFQFNPEDPTLNKIEATIDVSSIHTRDENREAHLKSADFFDVEKYPNMTFVSKKFEPVRKGHFKVTGDLTIRDTTKEVVLEVEGPTDEIKDPWGGSRIGVTATTHLNRKEFGLHWNVALEAGGFLVGDDIKITIEAEFTKQA